MRKTVHLRFPSRVTVWTQLVIGWYHKLYADRHRVLDTLMSLLEDWRQTVYKTCLVILTAVCKGPVPPLY